MLKIPSATHLHSKFFGKTQSLVNEGIKNEKSKTNQELLKRACSSHILHKED